MGDRKIKEERQRVLRRAQGDLFRWAQQNSPTVSLSTTQTRSVSKKSDVWPAVSSRPLQLAEIQRALRNANAVARVLRSLKKAQTPK
jgi:hypothetical protein